MVQIRKTRPFITERLLMGRKESNQTKHFGFVSPAKQGRHIGIMTPVAAASSFSAPRPPIDNS